MKILKKFDFIDGRSYHKSFWSKNKNMLNQNFADYNLIYGWNGSGKTTLADILQMVEKRQPVSPESEQDGIRNFTITTDSPNGTEKIIAGNIATHRDLPSVRVFNRSFVENNVFSTKEEGAWWRRFSLLVKKILQTNKS